MRALVIADHDHQSIKGSTLNTVTAALACAPEVHVLVAGHNAGAAAAAAAQAQMAAIPATDIKFCGVDDPTCEACQ